MIGRTKRAKLAKKTPPLIEELSSQDGELKGDISQENSVWASGLPDLVMMMIFSYLNCHKDLIRAAMVCKTWKELAYDPAVWKERIVRVYGHLSADVYVDSFKQRGIRKLSLYFPDNRMAFCDKDSSIVDHTAKQICTVTQRMRDTLEELFLDRLYLTDHHISAAFDEPLPNIRRVRLDCYGIYTDKSILTVLKQCTQLRDLTHNTSLTPAITSSYGQYHAIKVRGRMDDSLTRNISLTMPDIVHLDLSRSKISDDAIRNIAQLQKLQRLFLSDCFYLTDECIDILSEAKTPIKELDLRWCAQLKLYSLFVKIGSSNLYLEKLYVTSSQYDVINGGDTILELVRNGRACDLQKLVIGGLFDKMRWESSKAMLSEKCKKLKLFKLDWGSKLVMIDPMSPNQSPPSSLPSHLAHPAPREAYLQIMEPLCNPQLPSHLRASRENLMALSDDDITDRMHGDRYAYYKKISEDATRLVRELNDPTHKREHVGLPIRPS